jgi:hypothetical protein
VTVYPLEGIGGVPATDLEAVTTASAEAPPVHLGPRLRLVPARSGPRREGPAVIRVLSAEPRASSRPSRRELPGGSKAGAAQASP